MGMFSAFNISGSGLTAEKLRLDLISGNLSNMNTTRTPHGGPYQRRTAVFAEQLNRAQQENTVGPRGGNGATVGAAEVGGGENGELPSPGAGVHVHHIHLDDAEPRMVYDPDHPDADEDGYVAYPNVEVAKEMTDMITAQRSYESNATSLNTAKEMYMKALEIGQ